MTQTVTVTPTDDECNFDRWLEDNNLKDAKQIFIEHNMTTLDDLSLQNKNLGPLLADRRFYEKSNVVAHIFAAIQSLEKQRQQQLSTNNIYIITSPKEHEIMKQLQQYVDDMKQLQNESKHIHNAYNNKVISNNKILKEYETKCIHELRDISNHVKSCVNQLKELVKLKETSLFLKIGKYHGKLQQQKSRHMNDINAVDEAIDKILNKYAIAINKGIRDDKSKIVKCKNVMQKYTSKENEKFDEYSGLSHNAQREKRIVDIAENAQVHFTNIKKKIKDYEKRIKRMNSNKLNLITNHSLQSFTVDEKKNCEDTKEDEKESCEEDDKKTSSVHPWTIYINKSLYEEIENDVNSFMSISSHSKYENNNNEQQRIYLQKLKTQLEVKKGRKHQLELQLAKLHDTSKSDAKFIERLECKRNALHKKVQQYRANFEEKNNIEPKYNKKTKTEYVPLQTNKRKLHGVRIGRKFDIQGSRLWNVSLDGTRITSCCDRNPNWKIKSQHSDANALSAIYPSHKNKRGYNSGTHSWSLQQKHAVGTRIIGITSKRSNNNVEFVACLDGCKESKWKSGDIIHVVLDCDKSLVSFYKTDITDRNITKNIKVQKILPKKSYYFVLLANPWGSTGSLEYISVATRLYINIYDNKEIKWLGKKRHSMKGLEAKKKRKSKKKDYSSDGDAEEMKHEYTRVIADNASDVSTVALASLSPKSVKSDGASGNRSIKWKLQRSNHRSKSKGATQVAKGSSKSKYKTSYIASFI